VGEGVLRESSFPGLAEEVLEMVSRCPDGGRRKTAFLFHVATVSIDLALMWTRCAI
jgi:hypothetical protein